MMLLARPHAQTRTPLTFTGLTAIQRLNVPQLSPDGKTLVYFLGNADWKADRFVYHLWRQPLEGGTPAQITFSEGGDIPAPGSLRWSPDGRTLLFMRDGQIYLIAADGGEPRALTHHATSVSSPSWTPDGTAVYFLSTDPQTAGEKERDRLRDDLYALDENYKQSQLWKIVVSTGGETQITAGNSSVLEYRLSTDGTRVAFHRAPTPMNSDQYRGEVWVMDADGGNAHQITHNMVDESNAELSPDNSQVLFLADTNARFEPYYNTNLFIVSASGGTPRLLLPDFKYAFDQAEWTSDGRAILAAVNMGVHSEIFRIDVATGRTTQLTNGQHFVAWNGGGWQIVPGAGLMIVQFDEPTRFGEAWSMPIDGSAAPVRRTHVFDAIERDIALPRQELFTWRSTDGTIIEGILFYPIEYQPGTRYPLVVQMHGGPMESDKFGAGPGVLQNYFPVLAAKGYVVLRPNYRGSAGYGNVFYRDIVGHFFDHMTQDVMTGVDALVAKGIVDPNQLALMGWSAGAHLTNKLITMTDRFKAASAGAGLAEWTSFYGQTDWRVNRNVWFGGSPWQKNAPIDVFWGSSPLKDVANVKTPTLFFVGENDRRVPLPQSIEMYRALASNGVPTHLYVAPREGHQWGELRHLLFKANAELEWFEKYVRGRAYTWETIP
jgi:dipeptidyl aminopeptidase/acylaminoacyl peptidase